jgi:hypothetical protein
LHVQALGYAPLITTISLTADSTLAVDIDFERRRATGMGRFLSRAELLRESGRSLAWVLRSRIPGTRVWDVGSAQVLGASRGRISVQRGDVE